MRDVNRLDNFYDELKKMHKCLPDWRFGQFIINFMNWHYQKYKIDCFYIEETKMLERIKEFLNEIRG